VLGLPVRIHFHFSSFRSNGRQRIVADVSWCIFSAVSAVPSRCAMTNHSFIFSLNSSYVSTVNVWVSLNSVFFSRDCSALYTDIDRYEDHFLQLYISFFAWFPLEDFYRTVCDILSSDSDPDRYAFNSYSLNFRPADLCSSSSIFHLNGIVSWKYLDLKVELSSLESFDERLNVVFDQFQFFLGFEDRYYNYVEWG